MGLFSKISRLFQAGPVDGRAGLAAFLESRAAYLAQKSIAEYSQARANMLYSTLMREKSFIAAHEHARWFSYPAAFAMVAEMAMGHLRAEEPGATLAIEAELAAIGAEVFGRFPLPAGAPPLFWQEAGEALARDLAKAGLGEPRQVRLIPLARAREIFDVLPVHPSIRGRDGDMFQNTLKLHLTEISDEFTSRADIKALLGVIARRGADQAPA